MGNSNLDLWGGVQVLCCLIHHVCFDNKKLLFLLILIIKYFKIWKTSNASVTKSYVTMCVHLFTATPTPGKRTGNKPPCSSFLCLLNVQQHNTNTFTHFLDNSVPKFTNSLPLKHAHYLSLSVFLVVWLSVEQPRLITFPPSVCLPLQLRSQLCGPNQPCRTLGTYFVPGCGIFHICNGLIWYCSQFFPLLPIYDRFLILNYFNIHVCCPSHPQTFHVLGSYRLFKSH